MFNPDDNGFIYITGKIGSYLAFLLSTIDRKTLVFYEAEDEAFLLREEIEFFTKKEVHLFPVYSDRVFEREDEIKRTGFLYHLSSNDQFIGLFPYSALRHPLPGHQAITGSVEQIRFGDTVYQEDLTAYLEDAGYELSSLVRESGEYAKRGSIIDIYPPSSQRPIRIEFLGDQVYSLRFFDPGTQRSLKELEACTLTPSKHSKDGNAMLYDYFESNMALVHKGLHMVIREFNDGSDPVFLEGLRKRCGSMLNIDTSGVEEEKGITVKAVSNEDLKIIFQNRKTEIFKILTERFRNEWNGLRYIYLFVNARHQAERLQEIFKNYDISLPILTEMALSKKEREWGIVTGPLRRGFRTDDVIVLTEEDVMGPKKRVVKKQWNGLDEFLNSFKDLKIGEWVVHIEHGIGVYKGITALKVGGHTKDFLLIEYQEGDKLYVPVSDLHLVQKFIGSEKHKPKIDRLGSQIWKNTKRRVKKQVEDIAGELITIYAERELAEGHSYPPEDELFREMESRFEYEETEGQMQAIEDVIKDLQNTKPMDRLVCGDVGFGKTEVALRASFKAALDNKQVAVLVPTTILAQQHFKTFTERLGDYPVNIDMLSRFKTKEEQKEIAERIRRGAVDIVIGTHRLLQKDIQFRDIGLLIVDEEQRFGVKHKEKLKAMRKNIDVLTLSATPIPRTLYMASTGIKDLSVINTPPLDRLAVKTFVIKFNDGLIKKAISDELQRGGQVFFVHNYVHNIGVVYEHLKRLLPDVRIAVAHGKMDEKKLEKIMIDFIGGAYDILLSTNIIESGLDISNVNTIFINNAHRMGLSDLYQLRGRVGRSTKQAFAYLLVPKDEALTKDAALRLKIIEEMTDLGSGFHIANYDLEIRGAGNLLGKEQSGNINLIGFELYCEMLAEAVKGLKERPEEMEEEIIAEVNIPVDAYIPDAYIEDPAQKLLMYKRLSRIRDDEELADIKEELTDRYGAVPRPLLHLLDIISLKCFLTQAKIRKIEHSPKRLIIHVTDHTPIDMRKMLGMVSHGRNTMKLLPDGKIILQSDKTAEELVKYTRNVLMEIISI
jgi:transcription-repair coupling factor (superfamily II helicase)